MQICTWLRWRNAMVESNVSGSKGLTPYTCLCYHCCALEQGTKKCKLKGAKQSERPYGPLLLKIAPREMKHSLKMHVPGLGPGQSHYNQSRHWSRLHTTLAQMTHITPKWIYTEYTVWNIFHRSGFLSNLYLPWKTEFALKFYTLLNIFFTFRTLEQLALALKNRVALNSLYWTHIFYH